MGEGENSDAEDGNADIGLRTTTIDPSAPDDILTAPNGSYVATFTLSSDNEGSEVTLSQLDGLTIQLLDSDSNVLAENTLEDPANTGANLNDKVITTGFNIGVDDRDVSDWNMTEFIEVGETPTQLKATYTIDGTDYAVTENVSDVQAPSENYDDEVVQVANYIVNNFIITEAEEEDTLELLSDYSDYTATVTETNWNGTEFTSVEITDDNNDDEVVGTVLLRN